MELTVWGLNHKTTPVELREKLSFSEEEAKKFLSLAREDKIIKELLVLSTCNRTEFYFLTSDIPSTQKDLNDFIFKVKNNYLIDIDNLTYTLTSKEAVKHLFEVASGLDSQAIGENQILGQVKDAYRIACDAHSCGIFLHRLFHLSFRVGKRVRTETGLCTGAVSLSFVAVELANKIFGELNKKKVLLIGAGETVLLAAKHLLEKKIGELFIANRTFDKALNLARELGGKVVPFDRIYEHLGEIDILISSTGAPNFILTYEKTKEAIQKRGSRPLFIIDIAVPRDVDPQVDTLPNLFLYDIDSLNLVVDKNLKKRMEEIPKAQKIIQEETQNFMEWYESLQYKPIIKSLCQKFENIRKSEVEKNLKKFKEKKEFELFTKSLIKKLLHIPLVKIKSTQQETDEWFRKLDILKDLFELDKIDENEN